LSLASIVEPLDLKSPPAVKPLPIAAYVCEPFNRPEHSFCFVQEDADFNKDKSTRMVSLALKLAEYDATLHVIIKYNLHCAGKDVRNPDGFADLMTNGLCPPLEACPN
jgi:hypothetical protein